MPPTLTPEFTVTVSASPGIPPRHRCHCSRRHRCWWPGCTHTAPPPSVQVPGPPNRAPLLCCGSQYSTDRRRRSSSGSKRSALTLWRWVVPVPLATSKTQDRENALPTRRGSKLGHGRTILIAGRKVFDPSGANDLRQRVTLPPRRDGYACNSLNPCSLGSRSCNASMHAKTLPRERISAGIFTRNGSWHRANERKHAVTSERVGSLRFLRADNDKSEVANDAHRCQPFTTLTLPLYSHRIDSSPLGR